MSLGLGFCSSWRYETPNRPGLYLRINPNVRTVVIQRVLAGDGFVGPRGGLYIHANGKWAPLEDLQWARKPFWYGPIPEPPGEKDSTWA
jgi:hypothetical protein